MWVSPIFMKNILIIIANDFAHINGGTAKIAVGSAIELAKAGHRVIFFSAVGPVAPELSNVGNLTVICLEQREILHDPIRIRAAVQGFWNSTAASRMRALLAECDPGQTVLHLHGWTKALSSSVARTAIEAGVPVVITLHDYFTACPAGTFFQYPQGKICHLEPLSAKCVTLNCDVRSYAHKLWRVGRTFAQHYAGQLPSGVHDFISISSLSEEVLRPYLPADARVHRVTNFTDVPQLPPVDVAANTAFVYSGRFSAEKGARLFAQAAERVQVDALFIGDGPLRSEIERLAPAAEITGWLDPDRAVTELRRARALAFPSLWYETQGLVVAEAAANGIPAIVPDTCAAREWVQDGVTGLLFTGGEATSLEAKLRLLKENPALAAELGRNAYAHYWSNPPSLAKHCRDLEAVFSQVIAREPSPVG